MRHLTRWLSLLPLALALGAMVHCTQQGPPQRDCFARVWVPASEPGVTVVGVGPAWRGRVNPEPFDAAWRLARFELPPGEYPYLLDRGDRLTVDPFGALLDFDALEREVSVLVVPDCTAPKVLVDRIEHIGDRLRVEARFLASESQAELDPASIRNDADLTVLESDPDSGRIVLEGQVSGPRAAVTIEAADVRGRAAAPQPAIAFSGGPFDPRDAIIYQVVTDRLRGPDGAVLEPPPTAGSRAGGTLDGVQHMVDTGYFDELGVNMLWLSPAYLNPEGPRPGLDGRMYEGYHGYWPLDSRRVDPRLGGEVALESVVGAAHDRGYRVLLDVVPNHVYRDHPRVAEMADTGGFNPDGCICGTPACPWSSDILRCWFTDYLPDIRWQNADAATAAREDVRFWVERFDLDGVRVDAVPMMPRAASRRIAHDLRGLRAPADELFLLGEVFVGPGQLDELLVHLGPAGLDSVFDFPLMWAMHETIGRGGQGWAPIDELLDLEEELLPASSGSLFARIIDNHDTVRFISVAHGDAGGDPWDEPAEQPVDGEPYRRLALAHALVMTLPGAVVIYQGDEVGVAGAGDPDNRRVLPGDPALSEVQRELRDEVRTLAQLRRCHPALRRGDRTALRADETAYVFSRTTEDRRALVILSSSDQAQRIAVDDAWVDAITGEPVEGAADVGSLGYRILTAPSDPCAG